jgi:catechol 2,3-dioxygenase-like lactoylglutathione lyase family enzyme
MKLDRMDHVAIEVADLDARIERLCRTGAMRLLRRGTNNRTGQRLAMVGDPTGMKLELIENPDAHEPRFLHLAFRSGDVDAALASLVDQGWNHLRGPNDLREAEARSILLNDGDGLEMQVLAYEPTSPDIVEWVDEA